MDARAEKWAGQVVAQARVSGAPVTVERLTRLIDELSTVMDKVVGPVGFLALVRRAVHLARRPFGWFQDIEFQPGTAVALSGLKAVAEREALSDVEAGVTCLLGNLFQLLCAFIGEGLTLKLLVQTWPHLKNALGSDALGGV